MIRSCSMPIWLILGREFKGAPDDFRGCEPPFVRRFQKPRRFGRLVAEGDQRAERFALRAQRTRRIRCGADAGTRDRKLLRAVAHFDDDPLGGLAPDAGNSREHRDVLGFDNAQKIIDACTRQNSQRYFSTYTGYLEKPAKQPPLGVGAETE